MQIRTRAPLRALAIATALVAGTGVAAAAMVSPADDIEARTVRFETASDATDPTRSTPEEDRTSPPAPALGTADPAAETAAPGPVEETPVATATAPPSDVDEYTTHTVGDGSGRIPLPLSAPALLPDPPALAADVLALLPDRAVLTAAITHCTDELRTLVPDPPSNLASAAGLRGLVQALFARVPAAPPVARPAPAPLAP